MPFDTQTHSSRGQVLRRGPNLRAASDHELAQQQGAKRQHMSLQVLVIAAIASAVAAAVTRMLWPGATIVSAAMTPVIVACVKEVLWHPAERIKTGIGQLSDATTNPLRGRSVSSEKSTRLARLQALEADGELPLYKRVYGRKRLRLKPVLATGAAGFVLAAAAVSLPELVLGGSLVGGSSTTFFGSSAKQPAHAQAPAGPPGRATAHGQSSRGSQPSLGPGSPSTSYGRGSVGSQQGAQGRSSYGSPGDSSPGGQSPSQSSAPPPGDPGGGSQGSGSAPVPSLPVPSP